jgi:hypothetical protein
MLNPKDAGFIRLLMRSPDRGDGWRSVSSVCWPLVEEFTAKELLEINPDLLRVRLTEAGQAVAKG